MGYNKWETYTILMIAKEIRKKLEKEKQLEKIFKIGCNEDDTDWKKFFDEIAYPIFNKRTIRDYTRGNLLNAAINKIKEEIETEQDERRKNKELADPQLKIINNPKIKIGSKTETENKITGKTGTQKSKEKEPEDRQMNIITENIEATAETHNNIPNKPAKEEPKKRLPIQELLPPFSTFK